MFSAGLALGIAVWPGAWSVEALADAAPASAPPEASSAAGKWPALWSLSDHDTQIYLFGTVHILPAAAEWRSPLLERALGEAEILVLEADLFSEAGLRAAQTAYQRHAWAGPDAPLSFHLKPEHEAWLDAWANETGARRSSVERMRPWAAYLAVSQSRLRAAAGPGSASAEQALAEGGAALDMAGLAAGARELRFLETVGEQIQIFAGMSDADMALMLTDLLCQEYGDCEPDLAPAAPGDGMVETAYDTMLAAWLSGDVEALSPFVSPDNEEMSAAERRFISALYPERNARWAERIEALLREEPGVLLVAVGAGHFVEEGSLLALLEERGLVTERLQ